MKKSRGRKSRKNKKSFKMIRKKINMRGGGLTKLGIIDDEETVKKKLNNAFGNKDKFYSFIDKTEDRELMIKNTIDILNTSNTWLEVFKNTTIPRIRFDVVLTELFDDTTQIKEIKEIISSVSKSSVSIAPPPLLKSSVSIAPPPLLKSSVSIAPLLPQIKSESIIEQIKSKIKSTEEKVKNAGYEINRIEITMENRDDQILEINNRLNELCGTRGLIYLCLIKLSTETNIEFRDYAKPLIGTELHFIKINHLLPTEPYKMENYAMAANNATNVNSIAKNSSDGVSYFHHEFNKPKSPLTHLGIIYSDFGDYDEGFENCGTELIYFDKLTNTFNIFMMPVEEGDFIIFDDSQFMHRFPSKLLDNKSTFRRLLGSAWISLVEKREMMTVSGPEGSSTFMGNVYFERAEHPPELNMFLISHKWS